MLLVIPFVLLSLNRLGTKRLLGYHHFRQAHTCLAARNYAFHDANLLHPTIDGVTYGKDLYLNEFPLYPYVAGLFWRILGEHLFIPRLISIAFMVTALWWYYRLLLRFFTDRWLVNLALLAMSITPVVSYFGRCIERQSMFLAFLLLGTYWIVAYVEERRILAILPAALGLSLAVLLNPFAVYMALPIGWYALRRNGWRALLDWRLYAVALCAVAPALAWYGHAIAASRDLPTQQMMAVGAHRQFWSLSHYAPWLDADCWERMIKCVLTFVVPSLPAFLVFLYGVAAGPRDQALQFFRVWLLAVLLYFFADVYPIAVVVHEYYYLSISPLTAFFLAYGAVHIARTEWSSAVKVLDRDEQAWTLQVRLPQRFSGWFKLTMLVGAVAWFPWAALDGNRTMHRDSVHSDYYLLEQKLPDYVSRGKRLTVVSESGDPLLSYLIAPKVAHRLVNFRRDRWEETLRQADFDYLAITWDSMEFPLDEVLQALDQTGSFGDPVWQQQRFQLFQYRPKSPPSPPSAVDNAK